MFCIKCGSQLEDDLKFCIKCGAPVKNTNIKGFAQVKNREQMHSINKNEKGHKTNILILVFIILFAGISITGCIAGVILSKKDKITETQTFVSNEENIHSESKVANAASSGETFIPNELEKVCIQYIKKYDIEKNEESDCYDVKLFAPDIVKIILENKDSLEDGFTVEEFKSLVDSESDDEIEYVFAVEEDDEQSIHQGFIDTITLELMKEALSEYTINVQWTDETEGVTGQ